MGTIKYVLTLAQLWGRLGKDALQNGEPEEMRGGPQSSTAGVGGEAVGVSTSKSGPPVLGLAAHLQACHSDAMLLLNVS